LFKFRCDHPAQTLACTGSSSYCEKFRSSRRGRPATEIRLAIETGCPDSQNIVTRYFQPRLLSQPRLRDLVDFRAFPWGLARRLGSFGDTRPGYLPDLVFTDLVFENRFGCCQILSFIIYFFLKIDCALTVNINRCSFITLLTSSVYN